MKLRQTTERNLPMRKTLARFGMLALIAIATAAAGALAPAQQALPPNPGNVQGMIVNTVSVTAADRLKFLTSLLALTPNQQEQAKTILDDERSALQPLVDQMKQASAALDSAEKIASPDD